MGSLIQSKRRIYEPKEQQLTSFPIGALAAGSSQAVQWAVGTPSARVMQRIALVWWQQKTGQTLPYSGQFYDVTLGGNCFFNGCIWTAEPDETGELQPTGLLLGTQPINGAQVLPLDAPAPFGQGSHGFSIDVQGGQSFVAGSFAAVSIPGYANQRGINVSLRVKWEAMVEMCDSEWQDLLGRMTIAVGPYQGKG